MPNKNIQTFIGCDNEYDESQIVIFGAPFDSTTSFRPGARFAPKIMRSDSYGLETYSPYQNKSLDDVNVFDAGDPELNFGDPAKALSQLESFITPFVNDCKTPIMIGGEHLLTLAAVKALVKKYKDLRIIHFDAHTDLRSDYLGCELSHATVMRRCWDMLGDGRIFQFGIRSGDKPEFEWQKKHVQARLFDFEGLRDVVKSLKDMPVYFTIDLDVMDPSIFPGTGTPEPGGVTFDALREAVTLTASTLRIVGADVMELSPPYDQSGISTAAACKILRELILALHKHT